MKSIPLFLSLLSLTTFAADKERSLEKYVEVPASRAEVWRAWTTSEGLASFFAEDNKVELTPGGAYEMYFLAESEKERGSEGCTVLAFSPNEMFSFSWNAPMKWPEVRRQYTRVVLTFKDLGEGRTGLHFSQTGWGTGKAWDEVYAYFESAWDTVLGRLVKRFSAKQ